MQATAQHDGSVARIGSTHTVPTATAVAWSAGRCCINAAPDGRRAMVM